MPPTVLLTKTARKEPIRTDTSLVETVRTYCPSTRKASIGDLKAELKIAIRDAKQRADKDGCAPFVAFLPSEEALRYSHNYKSSAFARQIEQMQKMLPTDIPMIVGMNAFVREGLTLINNGYLFTANELASLPKKSHPFPDSVVVNDFHKNTYSRFQKNPLRRLPFYVFDKMMRVRGSKSERDETPFPSINLKNASGISQAFELRICADVVAEPVLPDSNTILLVPACSLHIEKIPSFARGYRAMAVNDSHFGVNYVANEKCAHARLHELRGASWHLDSFTLR